MVTDSFVLSINTNDVIKDVINFSFMYISF